MGVRGDDRWAGWSTELRARWVDSVPMNSGYYVGRVDAYTVLDLNVDVRVPRIPGATVGLSATNILDNKHNEFVGAPDLGALFLMRVGYAF